MADEKRKKKPIDEEVFHFDRPLEEGPPKEPGNRVTVVENVYHHVARGMPEGVESRYDYDVESDEQAYARKFTIGEDWTPLDLGWLKDAAGMIVVKNEEQFKRNQTDEEKATTAAKVLELALDYGNNDDPVGQPQFTFPSGDPLVWLIHPGRSFRGFPSCPKNLFLRSQSGPIRCILFVTPR